MENFDEFEDLADVEEIITVKDEFGEEMEFFIIDALTHKGVNYLLVAPAEMDEDEYEATIIKQTEDEGESVIYMLVEEDDEFNEVAALFSSAEGDYEIEL